MEISYKPQYDPLSYTLPFPYEDFAWSWNLFQNNKKISEMELYSYRFLFIQISYDNPKSP